MAVPPKVLPFSFGDEAMSAGNMAQIQCIVTEGDSPLQIAWTMQGSEVSSGKHRGVSTLRVGEKSSLLIIESVTAEDSGLYTCTVSNKGGIVKYETELVVNGDY